MTAVLGRLCDRVAGLQDAARCVGVCQQVGRAALVAWCQDRSRHGWPDFRDTVAKDMGDVMFKIQDGKSDDDRCTALMPRHRIGFGRPYLRTHQVERREFPTQRQELDLLHRSNPIGLQVEDRKPVQVCTGKR